MKAAFRKGDDQASASPLDRREFQRLLSRALVLPLAAAFLIAVLIVWQIRSLTEMLTWVDHTEEVIKKTHQAQKHLIDMETSLRGYALTGKESYLPHYANAKRDFPESIRKVELLLAEEPLLQQRVTKVRALANEWVVRFTDLNVSQVRRGKKPFSLEVGREMMETMRSEIDELNLASGLERNKRVKRAHRLARFLYGSGVGAALVVGLLLALSSRRQIYRINQLYRVALDSRDKLLRQETHRSLQLQDLSETTAALASNVPMEERLQFVTDQILAILGAHDACCLVHDAGPDRCLRAVSSSSENGSIPQLPANHETLLDWVCRENRPSRAQGWMAVPLVDYGRNNLGFIQVFDRAQGEFSDEDELILLQIAQITSVAVENARLFEGQQNAIRTRDEFLSIASHELKTPLTSLKLQVQLIQKTLSKPERGPQATTESSLRVAVKSVDQLARLIDDMLDISRIATGHLTLQKEPFDLAELTREVLDRLEIQKQNPGCKIELSSPGTQWGSWDRFRIDQVITNLVTNATKYGAGSPVLVEISGADTGVTLAVRDFGIGIARENHQRIFQKFERVNSNTSVIGMGLGLYISKQIVEMHGGRLEVESELGLGSAFRVLLPVTVTSATTASISS